jgi:hypothetical protein
VWQVGPSCSTLISRVSLSQSAVMLFTYWKWPESPPCSEPLPARLKTRSFRRHGLGERLPIHIASISTSFVLYPV